MNGLAVDMGVFEDFIVIMGRMTCGKRDRCGSKEK